MSPHGDISTGPIALDSGSRDQRQIAKQPPIHDVSGALNVTDVVKMVG